MTKLMNPELTGRRRVERVSRTGFWARFVLGVLLAATLAACLDKERVLVEIQDDPEAALDAGDASDSDARALSDPSTDALLEPD